MSADEEIHVYSARSGNDVAVIVALPATSLVRNPEGQTVPGVVLSLDKARDLMDKIKSAIGQTKGR